MIPELYRSQDTDDLVLKRFLSIFADEFSLLTSLTAMFNQLYDVDRAPVDLLPYLGFLLGVNIEDPILDDNARKLIKFAVSTYKSKGTIASLQSLITNITGWPCVVVEEWTKLTTDNLPAGTSNINTNPFPLLTDPYNLAWAAYDAQVLAVYNWKGLGIWLDSGGATAGEKAQKEYLLNVAIPGHVAVGVTWTYFYIS